MIPVHYTVMFFGVLVAVIKTSRKSGGEEAEQSFDHLSYETRLEGAWEGASGPLDEQLGVGPEIQLGNLVLALRRVIETIIFGEPSKYYIHI